MVRLVLLSAVLKRLAWCSVLLNAKRPNEVRWTAGLVTEIRLAQHAHRPPKWGGRDQGEHQSFSVLPGLHHRWVTHLSCRAGGLGVHGVWIHTQNEGTAEHRTRLGAI